jgi:RHS repeat-associated protein
VLARCRANNPQWCVKLEWEAGLFPYSPGPRVPEHWHGTLMGEKRDASGLLYRRNRYYDPATGRFTQEDPIGLAGGINVYGFAAGDPVSYSDPYGLSTCDKATDRIGLLACKVGQKVAPAAPALNAAALAITMLPLVEGYGGMAVLGLSAARGANMLEAAGVLGGSIRAVNAVGGSSNCANCVIATAATLAGRPASALSGGVTSRSALQAYYGSTFVDMGATTARIETAMQTAGDGAQGIVFAYKWGEKVGHFVNVINQNGAVRFLDGQVGGAASLGRYNYFMLMRITNP